MTDTDLERRLRQALAARAAAVTAQDLRPAADPARAERRTALARWWLPLAAGAAAAAVSITAFVLLGPSGREPDPAPVMPGATVSAEPAPPSSPDVSAPSSPEVSATSSPKVSATSSPGVSVTSSPDGPLASPSASSTIPATAVPTSIPRSALPASPG